MSPLMIAQFTFSGMVPRLIDKAHSLGFEVSLGEAWRTPEQAALYAKKGKGISNSLHTDKLAIDINLFKDGKYLSSTEDHRTLGEWWEEVGGTWGGRFGDGNHYSLAFGGRK